MVLGGHGDEMVPLRGFTSVAAAHHRAAGPEVIERLVQRTRQGGGEIVKYLKAGSAYYAPGPPRPRWWRAIVKDEKRLLGASAYLAASTGTRTFSWACRVLLGRGGVEKIVELPLTEEEKRELDRSAGAVREGLRLLDTFYRPGGAA